MLVFLSARMFSEPKEKTYIAAALIELLHTATLVHDDVVDEAMTRRGFFSINALWKNKIAVLFGDYLLSRGLLLSINNDAFDLLKIVATAVKEMSEGELLQQEKSRRMKVNEEVYYRIIQQKTASLIAACCAMGAAASDALEEDKQKMYELGMSIGIAFQIKDDLLDLGFGSDIGKPVGADIQENKITLPIIFALEKGTTQQQKQIKLLLKKKSISSSDLSGLQQILMDTRAVEFAQQAMNQYADKAKQILMGYSKCAVNTAFQQLVDFTIQRNK
jgi:octaprenyl-diphosphate synthase